MIKRSYQVRSRGDGEQNCGWTESVLEDCTEGEVRVAVQWSAINYKDALCASGHPGVARQLPMVPGIDAGGRVISSRDDRFPVGTEVFVAEPRFGTQVDGGFSSAVQLPGDWVFPVPSGLSLRETVLLGTAGFTAAQCVESLIEAGVKPESGPIAVTGASGGVGCFAVAILSRLGYQVSAVSGKPEQTGWLESLGAREVLPREQVRDASDRPLLSARWAGAVDTVGGPVLATLLRSTRQNGCVAACGLAGSHELNLTVYPFILRGVRLQGIDSANIDRERRMQIWARLAGPLRPPALETAAHTIGFPELGPAIRQILAGGAVGRFLVRVGDEPAA